MKLSKFPLWVNCLVQLYVHERYRSVAEISHDMHVDRGRLSKVLETMREHGLVHKRESLIDSRSSSIELTFDGMVHARNVQPLYNLVSKNKEEKELWI